MHRPGRKRRPSPSAITSRRFGRFCEGPAQASVARALRGQGLAMDGAEEIGIYLAKHGECYHPARVVAQACGDRIEWVVNGAVSAAGAAIIQNEFAVLQRLTREFSPSYLPEVYVLGDVQVQPGRPLSMFLGEWLAGFHEFHLTRSGPGAEMGVVLWDPENGNRIPGPRPGEGALCPGRPGPHALFQRCNGGVHRCVAPCRQATSSSTSRAMLPSRG